MCGIFEEFFQCTADVEINDVVLQWESGQVDKMMIGSWF